MDEPNIPPVYIPGLRDLDAGVVADIYRQYRYPVMDAVARLGGSSADGAVFFQLAVLELGRLARENAVPDDASPLEWLTALTRAQYIDWLAERGQTLAPTETEAPDAEVEMPDSAALQLTRHKATAWKTLHRLSGVCQDALLSAPVAEQTKIASDCEALWRQALGLPLPAADENAGGLPAWADEARSDATGFQLWKLTHEQEQRFSSRETVQPDATKNRRIGMILLGLVIAVFAATAVYQAFFRPKDPTEIYEDNFNMPPGIVADLQQRYQGQAGLDSNNVWPEPCMPLFEEADGYYRDKNYRAAAQLLEMLFDESLAPCQSDAAYYLGIIAIQVDEPGLALQYLSKIDNLDSYGEDIYWYQALAFMKGAGEDPGLKPMARRAVQRAISNCRDPERRKQAEKMLEQLGE